MLPSPNPPAVVVELASKVSGIPLSWRVTPCAVIIVMRDGRKITFEKDEDGEERGETAVPEIKSERKEKKKK